MNTINLSNKSVEAIIGNAFNAGMGLSRQPTRMCNIQNLMAKTGKTPTATIEQDKNIINLLIQVGEDTVSQFQLVVDGGELHAKSELNLKTIREHLNRYIVGQENAKKQLARALYMHIQNIEDASNDAVTLDKQTVLLVGPAASGKTKLGETLGHISGLPYMMVNSPEVTPTGYRGKNIETIALDIFNKAGQDVQKAEQAIVQFDEFDKMFAVAGGAEEASLRTAALADLLKFIEGTEISFDCTIGENKQRVTINTKNMLVIASGAFEGIEKAFEKKGSIGLLAEQGSKPSYNDVIEQHGDRVFEAAGMNKQMLGRFNVRVAMTALDEASLITVQKDVPDSIMQQWIKRFAKEGVTLSICESVMAYAAEKAVQAGTGARELKTVYNKLLGDVFDDVLMGDVAGNIHLRLGEDGEPTVINTPKTAVIHAEECETYVA